MLAAVVFGLPVAVGEFVDAYAAAGACMDEFAAAEVDAAVGGTWLIGGEEDEVAWLELA